MSFIHFWLPWFNIIISKTFLVHNWSHAALNFQILYILIFIIQYRAKITPNSVKNIFYFSIWIDFLLFSGIHQLWNLSAETRLARFQCVDSHCHLIKHSTCFTRLILGDSSIYTNCSEQCIHVCLVKRKFGF